MVIGVFGPSCPLTAWAIDVLKAILSEVAGGYVGLLASRPEELLSAWNDVGADCRKNILVYAEFPQSSLCDLFLSRGVPIVLAADDPVDIASFQMSTRQVDREAAIRYTTMVVAAASNVRSGPNVLSLLNDNYKIEIRDLVRKIVNFLSLPASEEQIEAIARRIVGGSADGGSETVGTAILRTNPHARLPGKYDIRDQSSRSLLNLVLPRYRCFLEDKPTGPIVWPREMFMEADRPGQSAIGPISLRGPGRCLIYGPYLHLARGVWTARVEIEVDDNYSGNYLTSDILYNFTKSLTGIKAVLPTRGIFEYALTFECTEPAYPFELRIMLDRGGIEGRFLLRMAELTRAGDIDGAPRIPALSAATEGPGLLQWLQEESAGPGAAA